jgi:hypothetical protein
VEGKQDNEMGKAVEVSEARRELVEDDDFPFYAVEESGRGQGRRGDVPGSLERGVDDADSPEAEGRGPHGPGPASVTH